MTQAPIGMASTPASEGGGPSRRGFLAGSAALAGVGGLAACAPGGDAPAQPSGDPSGPSASGGPAALVALADVPVGGAVSVTTPEGDPIVVAQPQEGEVVAFSAICTHQGCVVKPESSELHCPCHGSVFKAFTGERVSGPAERPLDAVAVEVKDGQVVPA